MVRGPARGAALCWRQPPRTVGWDKLGCLAATLALSQSVRQDHGSQLWLQLAIVATMLTRPRLTGTACRRAPLLQAQKGQLRQQLDAASKARESARASMKELRGTMKFTKGAHCGRQQLTGQQKWFQPGCSGSRTGAAGRCPVPPVPSFLPSGSAVGRPAVAVAYCQQPLGGRAHAAAAPLAPCSGGH